MKMTIRLLNISTLLIFIFTTSCSNQQTTQSEYSERTQADSVSQGYNELANANKKETFSISDYNSDNENIENVKRPALSTIATTLDTALLFHAWTLNPDGPHADFDFTAESFYVVDYDGNGDMPYDLIDQHLKIYYNDFIQEGEIVFISSDTMKILWADVQEPTAFVRWRQ